MARRPLMGTKVPATCQNRHEKVRDQLDQFERLLGHQNAQIAELHRGHRMLADAIEELAKEHPVDVALALGNIDPTAKRIGGRPGSR